MNDDKNIVILERLDMKILSLMDRISEKEGEWNNLDKKAKREINTLMRELDTLIHKRYGYERGEEDK